MSRVGVGVLAGLGGVIIGVLGAVVVLVLLAVTHHDGNEPTELQYACSDDRAVCLSRTEQGPFLGVGEPTRRINVYLMDDQGEPLSRFTYYYDPFHADEVNIDLSRVAERIVLTSGEQMLVLDAQSYGTVG